MANLGGSTLDLGHPVAVFCPACREHRQYRPNEVYEGWQPFELIQNGKAA